MCVFIRKRAASIVVNPGNDHPYSRIEKIVVHDSENIALLKLRQPLTFSETLNKIDLPTANKNIYNTPVNISGLGSSYRVSFPFFGNKKFYHYLSLNIYYYRIIFLIYLRIVQKDNISNNINFIARTNVKGIKIFNNYD